MKYSEAWNEMHKVSRSPSYYDPSFHSDDEDVFIGVINCAWCGKEIIAVWDERRLSKQTNRCTFPFYPRPYMGRPSERSGEKSVYTYSRVINAIRKKQNLFDVLVNVLFRVRNPDNRIAMEFLENPYDIELLCSNCFLKTAWQDQCKKAVKLRNTCYRIIISSPTQSKEEILTGLGFRRSVGKKETGNLWRLDRSMLPGKTEFF
ncbi:MAG: hypothetical protein J6P10_02765 [Aeriscardovia sp.]|nr:hypothetical protein [Aeriscardovia sp.]